MVKRFIFLFVLFLLTSKINIFAQQSDIQVGTVPRVAQQMAGYFDYSDPRAVNIKVSIWGYTKFPGKYIVPVNTTVKDLISFAGGPTPDAYMEDIRLVHTGPDSTQEIIKFDYNELMFEKSVSKRVNNAILQPGDILVLPGEPRMYFKDYFSMTLSVVSTLISLTILIYTIVRK